jgi:hypothetical protein
MKKSIIITDLTRMQNNRVCVAGYDTTGSCIRPVLPPPGILEHHLSWQGRVVVFPFALVEYDFIQKTPQPPHTEDYRYDPRHVRLVRRADDAQKRDVLNRSTFASVSAIFEQPILQGPGHYVMDGKGPRSLGTVRPKQILKVMYALGERGQWQYRLNFVDGANVTYWFTITDLAWRYYCDRQRDARQAPDHIAAQLTATLQNSEVYIRMGLARQWEKYPDRCFLQITGVHTFPDYLQGKTFAELAPTQ